MFSLRYFSDAADYLVALEFIKKYASKVVAQSTGLYRLRFSITCRTDVILSFQ